MMIERYATTPYGDIYGPTKPLRTNEKREKKRRKKRNKEDKNAFQ